MGLFRPSQWRKNAVQNQSLVDLGPMNTNASHSFYVVLLESFVKVMVPCCAIMTTSYIKLQAASLTLLQLAVVLCAFYFPTHNTPSMNSLFVGIKVAGLWVTLSADYCVIAATVNRDDVIPSVGWLLNCGLLVILLAGGVVYTFLHTRERKTHAEMRELMMMQRDTAPDSDAEE